MTDIPSAKNIERIVLCIAMNDNKTIPVVLEASGRMSLFYDPRHERIWDAISRMHREGTPVDPYTVSERLRDMGILEDVGGEEAVVSISCETLSTVNIEHYCEILKSKAVRRKLMLIATTINTACADNEEESIIYANIQRSLEEIQSVDTRHIVGVDEIIFGVYDKLQQWSKSDNGAVGVTTGIPKLDKYTMGLMPGRMIVLGGITGEGKTALALSIMLHATRNGIPVLYISTEMSHFDIGLRLQAMCMTKEIDHKYLSSLTRQQWEHTNRISDKISKLPMLIASYPGVDVLEIGTMIENTKRTHGIGLVIVDYLQQVRGITRESRRLAVESVSLSLKQFSGKYDIPVLALSQFARKEGSPGDEPQLSWLRETGSIEQDADQIMLIWNPDDKVKEEILSKFRFDEPKQPTTNNLRVLLLKKNRFGKKSKIFISMSDEGALFQPLDYTANEGEGGMT